MYPLPSAIAFNRTVAIFDYMNLISPIFVPSIITFTFIGFFVRQLLVEEPFENALFSASYLSAILSALFYFMGAISAYFLVGSLLIACIAFAMLKWTKPQAT